MTDLRTALKSHVNGKIAETKSIISRYNGLRYTLDILQVLTQITTLVTSGITFSDNIKTQVLPVITVTTGGVSLLIISLKKLFVTPTQKSFNFQATLRELESIQLELCDDTSDIKIIKDRYNKILNEVYKENIIIEDSNV